MCRLVGSGCKGPTALSLPCASPTPLKRGMLSDAERRRYDKPAATVHEAFTIVGLGQLVEAMSASDRFVTSTPDVQENSVFAEPGALWFKLCA